MLKKSLFSMCTSTWNIKTGFWYSGKFCTEWFKVFFTYDRYFPFGKNFLTLGESTTIWENYTQQVKKFFGWHHPIKTVKSFPSWDDTISSSMSSIIHFTGQCDQIIIYIAGYMYDYQLFSINI